MAEKFLSKSALLQRLSTYASDTHSSTHIAKGEESAIIGMSALSGQLFIEGVHFDLHYMPLHYLGYKIVSLSLVDCYAMNARPQQLMLSLALSNRINTAQLDHFYKGITQACTIYGIDLVEGGDLTASRTGFTIATTILGMVNKEKIVRRSTARVGEILCVSQHLGAAYLGLLLLEREKRIHLEHPDIVPNFEEQASILEAYLRPQAPQKIIDFFDQEKILPTAMTTLNEGLANAVFTLCAASKVGCTLYESKLPILEEVQNFAHSFPIDATLCTLSGGEECGLAFTISPSIYKLYEDKEIMYPVGVITQGDEKLLQTKGGIYHTLKAQGW